MTPRRILIAILALGIAFAGYQVYELTQHASSDERAAAPSAPPPAPLPFPKPAPVEPNAPVRVTGPLGFDAPFEAGIARRVTATDVEAMLDKGVKIRFVDTRGEVDGPIIAGAELVDEERLAAWAKSVPKSATIVIYCTCGRESAAEREVLELQKLGYRNAFALLDGLAAWESAGYPTELAPRR